MTKAFKKISAAITAAAIAASLSGCADNGVIMIVDGMEIKNGVYISLLKTSVNLANTEIEEIKAAESGNSTDNSGNSGNSDNSDNSDSTASESEKVDVFDYEIDGKSYSDWIIDDTRAGVMRFVGIQRECERLGIALTDEEKSEVNETLDKQWEDTSISYYGMGFSTWGEYYESMGIGLESMKQLTIADELNNKLFLHYYDEGGEWAVSDEEFAAAANENYAAYNVIELKYLDYKGDLLVLDEEKQEVKDRAKGYAERFNNGEDFLDIIYDEDWLNARNDAKAEAEKSYTGNNADGLTKEEYIQKAIDDVSVTRADDIAEYDRMIEKDGSSSESAELSEFVFGLGVDGKAYVLEGTSAAYVVVRKSVLDLENWELYYRADVLRDMKGDEFDSRMDIICQNYDVVANDYLINHKYSPKKIING